MSKYRITMEVEADNLDEAAKTFYESPDIPGKVVEVQSSSGYYMVRLYAKDRFDKILREAGRRIYAEEYRDVLTTALRGWLDTRDPTECMWGVDSIEFIGDVR